MPTLDDAEIQRLVFETFGFRRYTQDSPIQPDVWVQFLRHAESGNLDAKLSLILTPAETTGPGGRPAGGAGVLAEQLRRAILDTARRPQERDEAVRKGAIKIEPEDKLRAYRIAAAGRNVIIDVTFEEMLCYLVPITFWWTRVRPDFRDPNKLLTCLQDVAAKHKTVRRALIQLHDTEFIRFVALAAITHLIGSAKTDTEKTQVQVFLNTLAPKTGVGEDGFGTSEPIPMPLIALADLWDCYVEIAGRTFARSWKKTSAGAAAAAVETPALIWSIARNRLAQREAISTREPAATSLGTRLSSQARLSCQTVKADAAISLFSVSTCDLTWAVADTGIDALHPAFRDRSKDDKDGKPKGGRKGQAKAGAKRNDQEVAETLPPHRVVATLDFTRLRDLLAEEFDIGALVDTIPWELANNTESRDQRVVRLHTTIDSIRRRNVNGRDLDWSLLELLIRRKPSRDDVLTDPHGTHVAGILGGFLPEGVEGDDEPFIGVCPDIQLYDLRVFADDENGGQRGGDEFTILAALDYISWVNRDPERPTIHGVNLSLSLRHLVDAHACGRTPICDACNRLVASGVVVVAAAGNAGFDSRGGKASIGAGYRGTSITDPGNAEHVITVGATHRNDPHTYGVSYFSSRGPTGDGRMKPDLVAPGEKIRSTAPGGKMLIKDGTSMAAPHVSGVCALLMARHREFIGQPKRIKEVLLATATDLGRERCFQGAGLVDALRALQSV